jgi:hypothetical protein
MRKYKTLELYEKSLGKQLPSSYCGRVVIRYFFGKIQVGESLLVSMTKERIGMGDTEHFSYHRFCHLINLDIAKIGKL